MTTRTRIAAALLIATTTSAGLAAAAAHADAPRKTWQACATEDGEWTGQRCVWLASERGNGLGSSFFVNRSGAHRVSHARAARMLAR